MAVVMRNDEEIRDEVRGRLHADRRVDDSGIDVDVSQARVVLTGTVSTYDARTAAEEDAWRVAGVDTVDNQLTVRYPPGEAVPTDEEIASNALNTLRWQTDIDLSDVEIAVAGGHVTLRGTVDSYWKRVWAEKSAAGVPGVTGLTNELAVVPTEDFDDRVVAEEIEAALEKRLHAGAGRVQVKVVNGVVTLAGHVAGRGALRIAHDVAAHVPGVVSIVNELTIG
jgi:osmotically-inducible protein OsmY